MKSAFVFSILTAVLALGAGTAGAKVAVPAAAEPAKTKADSLSPERGPAAFAGTMKVESEYIWDGRANQPIVRIRDESTGIACYSFKDQFQCAPMPK